MESNIIRIFGGSKLKKKNTEPHHNFTGSHKKRHRDIERIPKSVEYQ